MRVAKSLVVFSCLAMVAVTGCDWGGSGSEESWNDSHSWANFTGKYTLRDNIVTEDNPAQQIRVVNELLTTTSGGSSYSGVFKNKALVAGSVSISAERMSYSDNGKGVLVGSGSPTIQPGTVNYVSGAWSVNFGTATSGQKVYASYLYTQDGSSSTKPAVNINSLNVVQRGNTITMTDNTGVAYSGRVTGSNVSSTGYTVSQNIRFSFEVSSSTGKIVGTLSGDWTGAQAGESGKMTNRLLVGTYSSGSSYADIKATSTTVTITPTAGTGTTTPAE